MATDIREIPTGSGVHSSSRSSEQSRYFSPPPPPHGATTQISTSNSMGQGGIRMFLWSIHAGKGIPHTTHLAGWDPFTSYIHRTVEGSTSGTSSYTHLALAKWEAHLSCSIPPSIWAVTWLNYGSANENMFMWQLIYSVIATHR